jgi:hypothetical protein
MDLRTFRRNGPGLAECESQAAWRRLWADRRAHRSLDTRGPVSNVAASWPQFGYRGANPFNVVRGARVNAVALASIANLMWLRRFSARYATLWSWLCRARSRLLSHLASDEARNEPGIDLSTSVAVVDAILLDSRLLPVRVPVSDAHCALGCL